MKVVVKLEGKSKVEISLNYENVASLISDLDDSPENAAFFSALTEYPSSYARENLAAKSNLNEAAVARLANDPDISVVRALVNYCEAFKRTADTKTLLDLAKRDLQIAESIAASVEVFETADIEKLSETLSKHADPRVRSALANNCSTPKKYLKLLLKDEDAKVARGAKNCLD